MISPDHLEFAWFLVFVILMSGYAILDGFDLGVGMLHLFSKKDEDEVFAEVGQRIVAAGYQLVEAISLAGFEQQHTLFVARRII